MDYALLYFCLRKDCFNRIGKSSLVRQYKQLKYHLLPRFLIRLRQKARILHSFSPTHMPRTSFLPSKFIPIAMYTAFYLYVLHIAHDNVLHP